MINNLWLNWNFAISGTNVMQRNQVNNYKKGIGQLVLMDIDATHRNVGGIFYANKQSILKKKNS